MTLSDLAALGSFVSGVAVLVSLAFLYFQMRQAQWYLRNSRGLSAEVWQKTRVWCPTWIDAPLLRAFWDAEKEFGNFTNEFVREIETAPARTSLPSAAIGTRAHERASP